MFNIRVCCLQNFAASSSVISEDVVEEEQVPDFVSEEVVEEEQVPDFMSQEVVWEEQVPGKIFGAVSGIVFHYDLFTV